jgi:serine/threonine protein kinase
MPITMEGRGCPCVVQVEREIRIHSRLQHANIVQLYASFEDNKYVYLVQEYAAGELPPDIHKQCT